MVATTQDARPEMRRVRIVTDSTADIPAALQAELDIAVVACQIYWGSDVYQDGRDLTPQEFLDRMARSRDLPRTTQPPLSSFVETYQRLLADPGCEGIVSIHVADSLSGTVNGAWAAAQAMDEPQRVVVVDSGQVSLGLGWAVIEAAQMALAGSTLAEVGQAVQGMVPRLRAGAMIDSLENLHKGGRVSRLTALLGTALEIKPLLSIQAGEVSIIARVRTRRRALDRLIALAQDWGQPKRACVLHTGAVDLAEELAARLRATWYPGTAVMGLVGAALATHLGVGAVGITALLAPEV